MSQSLLGNPSYLFLSEIIALLLTKLWINLKRCKLRVSLEKTLVKGCLGKNISYYVNLAEKRYFCLGRFHFIL